LSVPIIHESVNKTIYVLNEEIVLIYVLVYILCLYIIYIYYIYIYTHTHTHTEQFTLLVFNGSVSS
jgi:hypothetical protein